MTLLDTAKSCDFLKCPAQELSNGIVFVNGTQKFASLDFREVWSVFLMFFCIPEERKNMDLFQFIELQEEETELKTK